MRSCDSEFSVSSKDSFSGKAINQVYRAENGTAPQNRHNSEIASDRIAQAAANARFSAQFGADAEQSSS
jgi:hypothetical protein